MSTFEPTRPDATFHECDLCAGEGYTPGTDDECPGCDGTGEWFE